MLVPPTLYLTYEIHKSFDFCTVLSEFDGEGKRELISFRAGSVTRVTRSDRIVRPMYRLSSGAHNPVATRFARYAPGSEILYVPARI